VGAVEVVSISAACLSVEGQVQACMTDENYSDEILTDHRLRSCQGPQAAIWMFHNIFTFRVLQD
jgi:hypothetical protein